MGKILISIFSFLLFISFPVHSQINLSDFNTVKENIKVPPAPKIKEWTVAIYLNGRNNVDYYAFHDVNRFEKVGSNGDINIVVELGRAPELNFPGNDTPEEKWEGVRRYYIIHDDNMNRINSPLIEDLGKVDMGKWQTAANFLKWAKAKYPAKRYMFIIWDHGWGWIDPVQENSNLAENSKSISHDFTTNNYIKTTELKNIFKYAGPVDVYASMACFMQMAEVAYEIKDYAKVIVGSEEVIQLPSFNFEDFFKMLKKYPYASPQDAGLFMTLTFKEMYQRPEYYQLLVDGKYGTQLSAIKGSKLDTFAEYIKNIGELITTVKHPEVLSKAKKDVLRFEVGELDTDPDKLISFYADIYHFLELIDKYYPSKSDEWYRQYSLRWERLKKFIEKDLVIKNVYLHKDRTGKDFSNTHGISMHIPGKNGHLIDYYDTYTQLEFDKVTGWSKVIKFLESID